jgi:hypothetical protein
MDQLPQINKYNFLKSQNILKYKALQKAKEKIDIKQNT